MNKVARHPIRPSQSGFTLVEMLIVIALIGIVVAIAAPSFGRMRRYSKVTTATNSVFTGLFKARSLAMRRQRPVIIKVRTGAVPNGTNPRLELWACIDANSATKPGPDNLADGCGGDDAFPKPDETPFATGILQVNSASSANSVWFGTPTSAAVADYVPRFTNLGGLGAGAGTTYWFGFNPSGKLIPDGQSPFDGLTLGVPLQDISILPLSIPDSPAVAPNPAVDRLDFGGPEIYIAEFGATSNDANPNSHIYRKIEVLATGGIRIQSWRHLNGWEGIR